MRYEWMAESRGIVERGRRGRVRRMIAAITNDTTIKPANAGSSTAMIDIAAEPIHSVVETAKFPNPPVVTEEVDRVTTEDVCTIPATPAPPMIAADH